MSLENAAAEPVLHFRLSSVWSRMGRLLTSHLDMSTPSEAAPRGSGLRKVSLEGLLVAPLPVPLPGYDE